MNGWLLGWCQTVLGSVFALSMTAEDLSGRLKAATIGSSRFSRGVRCDSTT